MVFWVPTVGPRLFELVSLHGFLEDSHDFISRGLKEKLK